MSSARSLNQEQTFAASGGVIVFSAIFGPLVALTLWVGLTKGDYDGVILTLVALSAFATWFSFMAITIRNGGIQYRTMFRKQEISFADIREAGLEIGRKGQPFYALILKGENQKLAINAKPFSKRALTTLAKALVERCPSADLDKHIARLSEGRFGEVSRAGISAMWPLLARLFWPMLAIVTVSIFLMRLVSEVRR
jgi:hypothetical protein